MRAYKEGMRLADPRLMDFINEFDSHGPLRWQRSGPTSSCSEMNTLGIRQLVPTGPNEFIMK